MDYSVHIRKVAFQISIAAFLFIACTRSPEFRTMSGYLQWLNAEDNHLCQSKKANGFIIKVKYLPPEYLAILEANGNPGQLQQPDSQVSKTAAMEFEKEVSGNRQSLSFLLTIEPEPDKRPGSDIMLHDVHNYQQYKERFMDLNFNIDDKVTLNTGSQTYRPVLTSLENIYQLAPGRNIMLVFAPESASDTLFYEAEWLDFTVEDDIFGTGINHFTFNRSQMNQASLLIPKNNL